ncbi:putative aspartic proteinase GIP2 [Silene latifolia]|uniref:putative aspartic proteinase GIP2 n=1 Tax=Silene latifolia TaxID=37657 RepID=UPI003D7826AC
MYYIVVHTMAASIKHCLLNLSLLLLLSAATTTIATSFRPKALVLPISKDPITLQYTTKLTQRTPLIPVLVTLDLGAQFLWVNCDKGYTSSTYRPTRYNSAQCSFPYTKYRGTCSAPPRPGCNNDTCGLFPYNPFPNYGSSGDLGSDVIRVPSTDGANPGRVVTVPNLLFVCGHTFLLERLAKGAQGIVGLGRTKISLPSQFSAAFSFPRKFAICLTSSNSNGALFFGDGPYRFLPRTDASTQLIYTPLIINHNSTMFIYSEGEPSTEYFIGVTNIKINEKQVPLNKSLLSITNGLGGTKISTTIPYTTLESSIYNSVTNFFKKELKSVPTVKAVKPFKLCYNATSFSSTRGGPGVPTIDLVLQSEKVFWRIFGANSMVSVNDEVICLGFVDKGTNTKTSMTSIVIGGYQLEDNLLQFDLVTSRLGFSSSLLFRQTTCANFNFTSNV